MASMPEVSEITLADGKTLHQFRYLLGDKTGVAEVTKVGNQVKSLMQNVRRLEDDVVVLSKAVWNEGRKQFGVKFPEYDDFAQLSQLVRWTRVSLKAWICDPGASVLNQPEGKVGKGWVRECCIANSKVQGMNLKIVNPNEDDLDYFEERVPISILYVKTSGAGVYADLHDLASVEMGSDDLRALCPDLRQVRPVSLS